MKDQPMHDQAMDNAVRAETRKQEHTVRYQSRARAQKIMKRGRGSKRR